MLVPVNNILFIEPIKEPISDRLVVFQRKKDNEDIIKAKVINSSSQLAKVGDVILTNKHLCMDMEYKNQRFLITGDSNIHAIL